MQIAFQTTMQISLDNLLGFILLGIFMSQTIATWQLSKGMGQAKDADLRKRNRLWNIKPHFT
jgi:hypothetical protein